MDGICVFALTTLKQALSGEDGEKNKESQLTGLIATEEILARIVGALLHFGLN